MYYMKYGSDYNRTRNDQDYNRPKVQDLTNYHYEVSSGQRSLGDVPEFEVTREMCWNAVSNNPREFRFIPASVLDETLIKLCFEVHDESDWRYVTSVLQDISEEEMNNFING